MLTMDELFTGSTMGDYRFSELADGLDFGDNRPPLHGPFSERLVGVGTLSTRGQRRGLRTRLVGVGRLNTDVP